MQSVTVLVVDDDSQVRSFVRAILEDDGLRVVEAATGEEAIAKVRHQPIGLVLLDVVMPTMNGFAVVEALKRERGPFVPVILLTALDDPATRARGIAAGADEILPKPVHPFELRLRVRAMLRIQQLTSELHLANRRLQLLARTDELTHVLNRRGLWAILTREFRRAERYGGPLSLLAFDIDHFKAINDVHGHQAGDEVLRAVASELQGGLRDVDAVGRTGGEEFVVVAPETHMQEALGVAERIRKAVGEHAVHYNGRTIRVTVSCGVATHPFVPATTADELLRQADAALYRAKAHGRNCTELAQPQH